MPRDGMAVACATTSPGQPLNAALGDERVKGPGVKKPPEGRLAELEQFLKKNPDREIK